jgi:putative transposase
VYWIDVFTKDQYAWELMEILDYGGKNKGMPARRGREIFAWCIMPSHVHLIFRAKDNNPGDLLRDLKTYTSKKIQKMMIDNPQESRKEWMAWMMKRAGGKNSYIRGQQFWQHHNKPIELWSPDVINQKLDYLPRRQGGYSS